VLFRPKRAAYGVAGLRSGSGQRDARRALVAKPLASKPGPKVFHLTYIYFKLLLYTGGEGGIRTPGTSFSLYNGFANSRFHTLLFGINSLRSEELPHCWAKSPCLGAFVQLLCNQNFNCLPCRWTPITTVNDGESYGSRVGRLRQTGHYKGVW
jgi:hypothetical protein